MALTEKLERILKAKFADGAAFRADQTPEGRVIATIVSGSFEGKSEYQRQDELWQVFEDELSEDEKARIVIVIANTPDEDRALKEERDDVG